VKLVQALCTEHANLTSDGKRKGARVNTEAESIDALERGGLTSSSEEAAVMAVERRWSGTEARNMVNGNTTGKNRGNRAHPAGCGKCTSRMT